MQTLEWNIVLNVFYPFGALAGAFFVDRWGRKNTMAPASSFKLPLVLPSVLLLLI
jgi:hypothetical protein